MYRSFIQNVITINGFSEDAKEANTSQYERSIVVLNELKKSKSIAILWVVLGLGFASFIGILGRAYLAAKLGVMEDSEKVFIEMIKKVFTEDSNLALLAGLFIAGEVVKDLTANTERKSGVNDESRKNFR